MEIVLKTKQSTELKKPVAMLHSSNGLTLLQRKIANALLFNAYYKLQEQEEHTIHIPYLCKLIGYDSKDHKKIKQDLITLISTVIEWNLMDKRIEQGEEVWSASSIISSASIKGSICTYSYSGIMRKLLYRPEFYGRLNMEVMTRFNSTYGLALYENCIRYQNLKQTAQFELPVFRRLMGVGDNKYTIFRDFKRRVIDKAIEEVNLHSHINISVEYQKAGEQVKALQFIINNKKINTNLSESLKKEDALIDKLVNQYGFTLIKANEILKLYDHRYIENKIEIMVNSPSYRNGQIKNLASYLLKALKDDFKSAKSSVEKLKELKIIDLKNEKDKKQREVAYAIYVSKYLNKAIMEHYQKLEPKQKDELIKQFQKGMLNTVYNNILAKEGVEHPIISIRFCEFIRAHYKDWLDKFKSFEEYSATLEG